MEGERSAGEREFDAEITEQHPDERVAWTSTGGEVDHAGVVTFHKLDDTDTASPSSSTGSPRACSRRSARPSGVATHAVKNDLRHFKEYIEKKGAADGAWRGDVPAN